VTNKRYVGIPTPDMYKRIFEDNPEGRAIFEYLAGKYQARSHTIGGIDAILKTFDNNGAAKVIAFIDRQLDRANGATIDEPQDD
jgi:hypothetical protein